MRPVDYQAYYAGREKRYNYMMITMADLVRHIAIIISGLSMLAVIVVFLTNVIGSKLDEIDIANIPLEYKITNTDNYFEYQNNGTSAEYSVAYILREIKKNAKGSEIEIERPLGLLTPRTVSIVLRNRGIKAYAYHGSYNTIRKRLTLGIPIIVYLKINEKFEYTVLKGYDDTFFYFVTSSQEIKNDDGGWYNMKIGIDEFYYYWHTDSYLPNNLYVAFERYK